MPKPRMTCPRCGRDVAANQRRPAGRAYVGYPRVQGAQAAIRVPAPHRVQLANGRLGEWCTTRLHRGRPR